MTFNNFVDFFIPTCNKGFSLYVVQRHTLGEYVSNVGVLITLSYCCQYIKCASVQTRLAQAKLT